MRSLPLLLILAACGPEFAVIPHQGLPSVTANAPTGLTLTAFANQWEAYPDDLADYLTPISVELYNPGPNDVRILFCDFALKDGAGHRFPAINPFPQQPSDVGRLDFQLEKPMMLAARGGGGHGGGGHGGGGYRGGAYRSGGYRPGVVVVPSGGSRLHWGGGIGYGGPAFRYYGGLRSWFGPGAIYWGGAFVYPPWYRDWVLWWGPMYYPTARPPMDVMSLALPEGVLPAGGKIDGFLYFKKATSGNGGNLDLAWELVDAKSGEALGSLHVPLVAVRR
jgi:hypothetical protein